MLNRRILVVLIILSLIIINCLFIIKINLAYAKSLITSKDEVEFDLLDIEEKFKSKYDMNKNLIGFTDLNGDTTYYGYMEIGLELDIETLRDIIQNLTVDSFNSVSEILKYLANDVKLEYKINPRKFHNFYNICIVGNKERVKSNNSYIEQYGGSFYVVPEVNGDEFKNEAEQLLELRINEFLLESNSSTGIDLIDMYIKPDIIESDLIEDVEYLNSVLNFQLNLDLAAERSVNISKSDVLSFYDVVYNESPVTINLNKERVVEYVKPILEDINTLGKIRAFTTTNKENITIAKGDYGWWVNINYTLDSIISELSELKDRDSIKIPVKYNQTANSHEDGKDFGNTYVEISINSQHLWYYKNGELLLDCDIVTGNPNKGNATSKGIYSLTYKQRNAVLRGADYETNVDYWMPFNMHVGMHDATWQSSFGGERYLTHGSHGCINMPYNKARDLYNLLSDKFDCVIVY